MEGASKFLKGVLGDISTRSAYSQLFIGVTSGWYENTQTICYKTHPRKLMYRNAYMHIFKIEMRNIYLFVRIITYILYLYILLV